VVDKVREADATAAALIEQVLDAFRPRLIVNMIDNSDDEKEGWAIRSAAADLLSVEVEFLGCVSADHSVRQAVRELRPFLLHNPKSQASQDLAKLINLKILGKSSLKNFFGKRRLKKTLFDMQIGMPGTNLYEHAPICSSKCFYWGDCDFQTGGQLCPVRHVEVMFKS
jgi:hypothetical protein